MSFAVGSKVPYNINIKVHSPVMPTSSKLVLGFTTSTLVEKMLSLSQSTLLRSHGDNYELPIEQCQMLFAAILIVQQEDPAAHLPKTFVHGYLKNLVRDGYLSQEKAKELKSQFRYSYTSSQFEHAVSKGLNPDAYFKMSEDTYFTPVVHKL